MRRIYPLILILALIISSCSTQPELPVSSSGEGKLFFKVSKENAPAGVALITMKLTRSGFDPINGQLNLLTDTTAELMVEGIPEGNWNLKVDAFNNSNVIVYTGETQVLVQANFISQVNLTLNPVSGSLGSIKITVNWGTTPVNSYLFKDYINNPVLVPLDSGWDVDIRNPNIIYDGGKYRMYYTSLTYGARGAISYAESNDGLSWTRPFNHPLIYPGQPNTWDGQCITAGAIIKSNGIYYLYYTGFSSQNGPWHIGLATSTDGTNWTKREEPVLRAGSGWEFQVIASSVVKKGNQFLLYYTGRSYPQYKIGVATSENGVDFVRNPANPILSPTFGWEGSMNSTGSVIAEGDSLKMVYSAKQGNNTYFGMAKSANGINWTKNTTPVFDNLSTSAGWAKSSIDYPVFIKTDTQYRIYYGGYSGNQWTRIGVTIRNIN